MPPPNEYFNVPLRRVAIGNTDELRQPGAVKAAVAEFISTFIFVFAGSGSTIAYNKITGFAAATPTGLVAAAIAYGFALFVAVSIAANISGGHVNPAVTFGLFVGGNITLFRGLLYIIAQLLGSVVACFLLTFTTGGMEAPAFTVSAGVSVWAPLVFEIVMTFGLVYTVYATAVDPNKGQHSCRWRFHRRVDEPGGIIRAGSSELHLEAPLGFLGRPTHRWRDRRNCVRDLLYQPLRSRAPSRR